MDKGKHAGLGDEEIVRPLRGRRDPGAAPDLLMCMPGPLLELAVRTAKARETRVSGFGLYKAYQVKSASAGKPRLTAAGPFLGAPQAVMGLEELIALGASRIWVAGWCGSLQPDLGLGELVMPLSAVSEEGTSAHYPLPGRVPGADAGMVEGLRACLAKSGLRAREGRVWTTDAPYRETRAKVARFNELGVLAVEMELSALFKAAAFRGVKLASLLAVSDELSGDAWRHGFSSKKLQDACRDLVRVLLEVILCAPPGGLSTQ